MPESREYLGPFRADAAEMMEEPGDQPSGHGKRAMALMAGAGVAAVLLGSALVVQQAGGHDQAGQQVDSASTSAGCSDSLAPIVESSEFTPFSARRSQISTLELGRMLLKDATSAKDGDTNGIAPSSVGGEQLAGLATSSSGMVTAIFSSGAWKALEDTQDLAKFYSAGGLLLITFPAEEGQDVGTQTLKEEPTRTSSVRVGESTGALSWADPIDDAGLRPHVLQWTSGGQNLRLIAEHSPAELVLAARALECS